MAEALEETLAALIPAKATRGRPPAPVKCVETGQVFDSVDRAAEWLASIGVRLSPQTFRNAVCQGNIAGGFHWRRDGKPGPLKGAKYRPRSMPGVALSAPSPPASCVPRTPVVDSDGRAYRDAEVAAEVLRDNGFPDVTGLRIVHAIADGVRVAGFYFDWKGRGLDWCATEERTGVKCPECALRAAAKGMLTGLQL